MCLKVCDRKMAVSPGGSLNGIRIANLKWISR
jgi:hypothetical protein